MDAFERRPRQRILQIDDGGDTWTEISRNPGLPRRLIGKITVSVSVNESNRVYGSWRRKRAACSGTTTPAPHGRARASTEHPAASILFRVHSSDPKDRDIVYPMNVEFCRSRDARKTFNRLRTAHADHHDLWIAPDNPMRLIGANDGGGSVSTDSDVTWSPEQYPTAQLYHVVTTK